MELEVLESRRLLRQKVIELIQLAMNFSLSTDEIQQQLHLNLSEFGMQFTSQLLRSLNRDDPLVRQSIVRLLTMLNDTQTIESLQHMSLDKRLSRSIRLSASLALAGMEATEETHEIRLHTHLRLVNSG
ncbi:MAG TPA: hypothetical protein VED37_02315 [Ktedonobacteraceae bacterium]|nr:hypothetical protein [Ktedonobacteraceae bacterium]